MGFMPNARVTFQPNVDLVFFVKCEGRVSTQTRMSHLNKCDASVTFCAKHDGRAALQYADLRVPFQHQNARPVSNDEVRI